MHRYLNDLNQDMYHTGRLYRDTSSKRSLGTHGRYAVRAKLDAARAEFEFWAKACLAYSPRLLCDRQKNTQQRRRAHWL